MQLNAKIYLPSHLNQKNTPVMKKIIVFTLLTACIIGTSSSFAQNATDKKATKKETKMDKKDSKMETKENKMKPAKAEKKEAKGSKKDSKMDKKEAKGK